MSEPDGGVVLVLGSGPDAVRCRSWPREAITSIVAINNAWQVRPDWDFLVHPADFPSERRPGHLTSDQRLIDFSAFVPAVNDYGGMVFCGGTMAFTAAYWALHALRPAVLAFLGCDMIYTPGKRTHFYGKGRPDPLRSDVTLQSLEAKSARLALVAAARGCSAVNLSDQPRSRLLLDRIAVEDLDRPSAVPAPRDDADTRARVAALRARENALGYEVPCGRYWREAERFDPAQLQIIDRLWLDAFGLRAAA